jgi:aryl-alcohol dehydrogenase-like predicted oxidoreductase
VLDPPLAGLGSAVVTHSALSRAHARVREVLLSQGRMRAWSKALDADLEDSAVLAKLLLAAALRRNANGTVLWSSRSVAHIRANAQLVHDSPPARQLDVLGALLRELPPAFMAGEM